ncbi:MAG TPA: hypothetical protein ENG24_03395 [Thermoplasmatales archaeon]|nr:MAG: hypothetical protein DRN05_00050 [Thermoplasmata archaeon]RLI52110.1 MAG: hypothetical protein DRO93_15460 [Candidatus Thorarchaeota archaeon]HDM25622.1 hypothetical protein [Thermoplasmatales archaeon]
MFDLVAFTIGFVIGVVCVGLAIELGIKKTSKTEPASRSTHSWSISEIVNPRVVAEYLGDVEIPKNAKIVVNQYKNRDVLEGVDARENPSIKGNFIIGDDRALILSGPVKKDEMGIWTVEKEIISRLNRYFEEAWSKGTKIKQQKQ